MKKGIHVVLLTTWVGMLAVDADARRVRARGRRARLQANEPPVSAEISKALPFPWGTGHAKVIEHYSGQIRTDYNARLAKVRDAVAEDRMRTEMDGAISKVRDSFVEFRGQRTGWRVSFIGDEFRDNAGESMVVVTEASAQRFFFFKNDSLYKMFVAFNAEVFPGLNFEQFAERIQERYGPAQRVTRTNPRTSEEELVELRWQDETTNLAAIDQTGFYGIFSLRFTDKSAPVMQANAGSVRPNALIDQAIREGSGDSHSDVVDRITGRRRAAPAGNAVGGAQGGPTKNRAPAAAPAPAVQASETDPLAGI
jgi:hypothetical protein